MDWCECEPYRLSELQSVDGVLRHSRCGRSVTCEFSFLTDGPPHAAALIHVDYCVCVEHESIAINNVATRAT